ncbi:MAG TPA: hypothetical protein VIS72_05460 [Anaerolineales bacterium]
MKRFNWFEILLIVVVMSISLYAALSDAQNLSNRWFTRDDAYYYFKVAQNISEGHGFTFDGINRTNGYHPLWLFVCVPIFALARFDLILPLRILLLVMSGLSVATAILLYRLIRKVFAPALGAIAAMYWVFSGDVLKRVYQQGLETGIAAFFIVLFIYKLFEFEKTWRNQPVSSKQLGTLGIFAMLVMFSRLDLVFLAGMAGIWIVFRKHPMRYLLPQDIVTIVVSVLLALIYRVTFRDYYKFSDVAVTMIALSLLIKILGAYFLGLYQRSVLSNFATLLKRLTIFALSTSVILGAAMIVVTPLARFDGFPRSAIAYDLIATIVLFALPRLGVVGLRTKPWNTEPESSPTRQLTSDWKTWLNEGLAYYGVVFGALGIYMAWNKIAFGTFLPVSGQIKRWWGSLSGRVYGGSASNPLAFFGIDYRGEGNAWHPVSTFFGKWADMIYGGTFTDVQRYLILLFIFSITFYFLLCLNKHKAKNAIAQLGILPLLCGAWIQALSYHITGYSAFKEWYWISQLLIVVLTLSFIAGMMIHRVVQKFPVSQTALWLVAVSTAFVMGASHWGYVRQIMPYGYSTANAPYNDIAAFLEEYTEPGSIIGMTGGGNAGYFITDRTVINMDGLINSFDYFLILKEKEAGAYLAGIGMDYILANIDLINQLPYNSQFTPYTEWMDIRFGGKDLVRYHPIQQP